MPVVIRSTTVVYFIPFLGNMCVGYTEHPGLGKGCSRHRSLVTYQFLGSVICTARMLYDVMCCTYMFCFDLVIFLRLLWSCVALLRRGSRQLPALTRCLQANPILDRRQSGPTFSNSSAAHRKRLLEVCATVVFALVRTRCNLAPSRWSTRQTTWPQARQQTGPYQTTGIESPGSEVRGSPVSALVSSGTDANGLFRTHRERKEQYIRALETEVSRLREAYTQEISAANLTVVQHRDMVQSLSDENAILKDILTAHGINYEPEVERRKAERPTIGYQSSPFASSSTGSQPTGVAPSNPSTNNMYTTPPTTVSASLSPITTGIEQIDVSSSEMSPPQGPYQAAPCDALATLDQIAPVSRAPRQPSGIFEELPQLQIDFILTYARHIFISQRMV